MITIKLSEALRGLAWLLSGGGHHGYHESLWLDPTGTLYISESHCISSSPSVVGNFDRLSMLCPICDRETIWTYFDANGKTFNCKGEEINPEIQSICDVCSEPRPCDICAFHYQCPTIRHDKCVTDDYHLFLSEFLKSCSSCTHNKKLLDDYPCNQCHPTRCNKPGLPRWQGRYNLLEENDNVVT